MKTNKILRIFMLVILVIFFTGCSNKEDNFKLETMDDIYNLIDRLNANNNVDIPGLVTRKIELDDENINDYVKLSDISCVKKVVVSESKESDIPYLLMMIKIDKLSFTEQFKEDLVDNKVKYMEKIKKELTDNYYEVIWESEDVDVMYATNYNDIIFLVYGPSKYAKSQYNEFKLYVGKNIGKEIARFLYED